jgi:hypothetical protein
MKTFYWESKSIEYMNGGYIDAETAGKAKYKIWLKGACDFFETLSDFLKDIKIRTVKTE